MIRGGHSKWPSGRARGRANIYVVILVTSRFELSAVISDQLGRKNTNPWRSGSKYSPHPLPLMEMCDNVIPDGNIYRDIFIGDGTV